jgi:Mn2+/Fe2+ NRAMP family transporter
LNPEYGLFGIIGPFIASVVFVALGIGAAYLLRSRYDNQQIAEERGATGLLLIAIVGSFVFALIAFAIGTYATFVCCLMPA